MRKRYKCFLTIIVVLIILIIAITLYMRFFRKHPEEVTNISNVVNNISKFNYTLDDRDSELMKEEFNNLKKILDKENIDYLEYAKSLSKLFVIDLYTIENKINKYDIGSIEYILDSEKDKFRNIILDSIYENVLDNSSHEREQELPAVKSINIDEIIESEYTNGENSVQSYEVKLSWDYIEELGYDNKALITLIKEDEKLFVVEYNQLKEEGVE